MHLASVIGEAALKCGFQPTPNTKTATDRPVARRRVQVLPQKWWPDHKELIKSFVEHSTGEGARLVEHLRQQILASESKTTAIISKKHAIIGMDGRQVQPSGTPTYMKTTTIT